MFQGDDKKTDESIETLIGEKTRLNGDLEFSGGLHIDGEVDGSVVSSEPTGSVVHLSETSFIKGQLRAPVVVVNGRVEGDIHASDRLELQEKARVSGNIHYRSIEMRLGAEVNGQLVFEDASALKSVAAPRPAEKPMAKPLKESSSGS